jgi:hypothetical protein
MASSVGQEGAIWIEDNGIGRLLQNMHEMP